MDESIQQFTGGISSSSSFILIQAARPIETADKDNDIEAHTNIKTQRDRQRGTVQ